MHFGNKVPSLPGSSTENSGAVTSLDPRLRSRSSRSYQPNKPSTAHSNTAEDERSNSSFTSAQTEQNTSRGEKRHRDDSDESARNPATKIGKTTRSLPAAQKNPASVAKRNARERRRIKNVNLAFDELRQHVPSGENKKKISKVDTLQSAIEYIKALESLVKQKRKMEKQNIAKDDDETSDDVGDREDNESTDLSYENCGMSESFDDDVVCIQDAQEQQSPSSELAKSSVQQHRPMQSNAANGVGELLPMLSEFDVVVKKCVERNREMRDRPNRSQDIADFNNYIDFDDSGFSDDSASTHCDQSAQSCSNYSPENHVQPSLRDQNAPCATIYRHEVGYQDKEAFNCGIPNLQATFTGVSADEVQTLLEDPCTAYNDQSVFCPPSNDLYYNHGAPDFPSQCPGPNETPVFSHPPSSAPFASTPLTELNAKDASPMFVFPPNATGSGWVYTTQTLPDMQPAPVQSNELCLDIPNSSFDGYRFGDTFS